MVICLGTFRETKLIYRIRAVSFLKFQDSFKENGGKEFTYCTADCNGPIVVGVRFTTFFVKWTYNTIVPWVFSIG